MQSIAYNIIFSFNKKTIQQRCINVSLTEIYKYLDGISSELMNEVFYLHPSHYKKQFNSFCHR